MNEDGRCHYSRAHTPSRAGRWCPSPRRRPPGFAPPTHVRPPEKDTERRVRCKGMTSPPPARDNVSTPSHRDKTELADEAGVEASRLAAEAAAEAEGETTRLAAETAAETEVEVEAEPAHLAAAAAAAAAEVETPATAGDASWCTHLLALPDELLVIILTSVIDLWLRQLTLTAYPMSSLYVLLTARLHDQFRLVQGLRVCACCKGFALRVQEAARVVAHRNGWQLLEVGTTHNTTAASFNPRATGDRCKVALSNARLNFLGAPSLSRKLLVPWAAGHRGASELHRPLLLLYDENTRERDVSLVALARGASHGSASSLASNWRSRPSRWTLRGYDCSS